MIRILFVAPLEGNGGIVSWAANYRNAMQADVVLLSVGVSKRRALRKKVTKWNTIIDGVRDLKAVLREIDNALKQENDVKIMHMTTSGGKGTFRDLLIARKVRRKGIKCIMHCHYGNISQDYSNKGLKGLLLRKALCLFDQIWVLDNKSYNTLNNDACLKGKIELVPNFLEVPIEGTNDIKTFFKVGFVGNLIPTKGIYELTEAVKGCDNTQLDIIGPGEDNVINTIKRIAGNELGKRIFLHGRVDNSRAIEMIKSIDIIALPTYYPPEAFPISILEAMSHSKLVISCDRAAIPDMLKDKDGDLCGILVEPQSSTSIQTAIKWCQSHTIEANEMCKRAYQKVYDFYRTDVIVNVCLENYKKLL